MLRVALLALTSIAVSLAADTSPLLIQKPALSKTQVVFSYAGDLWSVPREGGDARRLTTGAGVETNPKFSPDGEWIAFTGEYDGNTDVFVMPAAGGVPKRLTWNPAPDIVLGWTADGKKILFTSPRTAYSRFSELFTVSPEGGLEEKLALPMGFDGCYSPDGTQIAYLPTPPAFATWKRYRGGRTTGIWLAQMSDGHIEKVPRQNSNDFNPMWIGNRVYFLSDRGGPISLYYYDTRSRQVERAVANDGLDFKSASAGPGAIVYEQFGSLHLYDLKLGKSATLTVRLAGDLPEVRERLVNVSKRLQNAQISPTGARAVFEARGEIMTVPAEKGDPRNLTNTTSVMERSPAWSPDGKMIAYLSDESGEYELHIRAQNGMGDAQKIRLGANAFYSFPRWSPDSKKIAYIDNHLTIWYVDLEKKQPVKVDKDNYFPAGPDLAASWSPDSRWLAYSKRLSNSMGAVFAYSLADDKSTQITDGMSDAKSPVWDKDGKYLYFTASTDSGPAMEQDLHSGIQRVSSSIYLAVLAKDQPSPFAPESDDEKAADDKKTPDAKPADKKDDDVAQKPDEAKPDAPKVQAPKPKMPEAANVKIDFDNIGQRILSIPMPARRYGGLQVGKAGVVFAIEAPAFTPGAPPAGAIVHRYDLKARKSDVPISGVRGFQVAYNGEKMLYQQGDRWFIAAIRPIPPGPAGAAPPAAAGTPPAAAGGPGGAAGSGPQALKIENIEVRIDPRAEWKQMYHEVWRIQRDFFYDPNHHGLDLKKAETTYQPYLASVASRGDLNYLFSEMLGELSVGHMYVMGGEQPEVKRVQTGLLGADYKIENGRYRFERVYNGENWNPQLRAPLTQPGVNVVAGEYLLAVNGRELRSTDNVYSFFEATADKSVVLKVGPDPTGANSREVTVVPVPNEQGLRNLAWIEDNRRKVDKMTNGRIAYVYMPDTAFGGLTNFTRYFFAQRGKEGVIIDERFNGGGALATDIIEILKRPLMSMVATRDGADMVQPVGAIFGPKAMIINEFAGSGGDAMPWYFHRSGAGKLIGKRTWGGLVGIAMVPELMDGGRVTSPNLAVFNPTTGKWEVENAGIAPDIEVEYDPELVRQGHDPQLEKAVQVVLEELEKNPLPKPKQPAYPNYHNKIVAGGR
jgi:tricorn protease